MKKVILALFCVLPSLAMFSACGSDDEEPEIIDANGKCISGTIFLTNGERESQYVFIHVLNYPEEEDKYKHIKVVAVPKDEFPLSRYQTGDIISFLIVEVKSPYLNVTYGPMIQNLYICSIKLCK